MTQVGLFIVKDHKSKIIKEKIFNKLMDILDYSDLNNVAYGETPDGLDMLYVFLDLDKHVGVPFVEQHHRRQVQLVKMDVYSCTGLTKFAIEHELSALHHLIK